MARTATKIAAVENEQPEVVHTPAEPATTQTPVAAAVHVAAQRARATPEQKAEILRLHAEGKTATAIADIEIVGHKFSYPTILNIIRGNSAGTTQGAAAPVQLSDLQKILIQIGSQYLQNGAVPADVMTEAKGLFAEKIAEARRKADEAYQRALAEI